MQSDDPESLSIFLSFNIKSFLNITTVKISSLYTIVDYIQYGLNDLFLKHIDQLWSLMFTDGRYTNNSDHNKLNRIITIAIHFNNDRALKYLINRIRKEIGPFQTMVKVNYNHGYVKQGYEMDVLCLCSMVFNLLVQDNIIIESSDLMKRMVKTAVLVIGDVDIVRTLFKRYNRQFGHLYTERYPLGSTTPSKIFTLLQRMDDQQFINLYEVTRKLNGQTIDGTTYVAVQSMILNRPNITKHMCMSMGDQLRSSRIVGQDKGWNRHQLFKIHYVTTDLQKSNVGEINHIEMEFSSVIGKRCN
ncbi:hypothetical protein DFA_10329 [Cavenderia fasciculata]|uniref:Uncharacterized protein n=1 Tax=Cavenderia fasciculata TaxID=261658 RepID=F4Q9X0_CACFS|nr:uncharacterized protein DFA_10329 [Cavenderia fasciculata]EGG15489.1 hypothetical protein DFA_10329 [Cavenderia fasciculata]|eukprot:XP_004354231.1 hypothetical protein DFA_10329 [Cavenderia fasciculata]